METGKTILAFKVYDKNCEICQHMSKHDRAAFESFPEVTYREIDLEDVINHGGDPLKLRVYQCLEVYALNPDYTIDLPVYTLFSPKGQYRGHHVGAATIVELRNKIRGFLEET